jgi:hypothetical protein
MQALAPDLGHGQVRIVIEGDAAEGACRLCREHRTESWLVGRVAAFAQLDAGKLVRAIRFGRSVTAIATEAGRLPLRAASKTGKVRFMRETLRRLRAAGGGGCGQCHHRHEEPTR